MLVRKLTAFILLLTFHQSQAPVPRCSPFIVINKVVESNNLFSDFNPYFPVPPCEYGGPLAALKAGDYEAVFGPKEDNLPLFPGNIPRHNIYEGIFLLKTALPRMGRYMRGEESFEVDWDILTEGYKHHTHTPRTKQFGHRATSRPELLDDDKLFEEHTGSMLHDLLLGGDMEPLGVTPIGEIRDKYKQSASKRIKRATLLAIGGRRAPCPHCSRGSE